MPNIESVRHDILLIITTALVILFVTALAGPLTPSPVPIVIPPG